jgi:hypothetical protein
MPFAHGLSKQAVSNTAQPAIPLNLLWLSRRQLSSLKYTSPFLHQKT